MPPENEGRISIDQAVGLLNVEPPQEEAPQEAAAEPEQPQEAPQEAPEQPESPQEPEEQPEAPEIEAAEEPDPEPEAEPLDPPLFWKSEDKAAFAQLPREAQERILGYENDRVVAHNKQLEAAATARKTYEAEAAKVLGLAERVNEIAARAEADFERPVEGLYDAEGRQMRWSDLDWDGLRRASPQDFATWRAQYDFEQAELQRIKTAQQETAQEAQKAALTQHHQRTAEDLNKVAPHLLANNGERINAVGNYLSQKGYSPERLLWAEASDFVIAEKAMAYDELQAKAKAARTGAQQAPTQPGAPRRPPQQASRPPVRPAPANTAPSPKSTAQEAYAKFTRSGKIDDAVAALTARGSG